MKEKERESESERVREREGKKGREGEREREREEKGRETMWMTLFAQCSHTSNLAGFQHFLLQEVL